jgi:hypothetical protein
MEPHGIPWNLMESHGTSRNPMEPHGIPQNLMESHGTSWNLTEPHGCAAFRNKGYSGPRLTKGPLLAACHPDCGMRIVTGSTISSRVSNTLLTETQRTFSPEAPSLLARSHESYRRVKQMRSLAWQLSGTCRRKIFTEHLCALLTCTAAVCKLDFRLCSQH